MPSSTGVITLDRLTATASPPQHHPTPSLTLLSASPQSTMRRASNLPLPAYTPSPRITESGPMSPVLSTPTPPSGKTSQVIERLTADADRLRRELRAEKAAREDALQEMQAMKGRISYLEEQNGTLSLQCSVSDSAVVRKERRLDDLRARVEQEETRRKAAEQQALAMSRELEDTVSRTGSEVAEARLREKAAEAAYSTIRHSYNALEGRIKLLRAEVGSYQRRLDEQRKAHTAQVTRLEVLLDQQRQAHEGSETQVREMAKVLASYRATEENVKKLEGEMKEAVTEMRWVMRLHQSRSGE